MKFLKELFLSYLIFLFIVYTVGCFINLSFNILEWGMVSRGITGTIVAFITIFDILILVARNLD